MSFPSAPSPRPRPGWTLEVLLVPPLRYLALLALAVSFVLPVQGLGVDLCLLHASTGLPCPGCGLSRAVAAISQGDFSAALGLNPFAFFAWPAFFGLSLLALMPARARRRVEESIRDLAQTAPLGRALELVFWAFLGFGAVRFAVFFALQMRFP